MPKVGMPAIRRPQLVEATMSAIDDVGLAGASVALISRKAGVSAGIINHYFGGKHGLLEETMRSVLRELSKGVQQRLNMTDPNDAKGRILAIVDGNFDPNQVSSKVTKTWLAFWSHAMHDPALFRLQHVNERRLLSHLRVELKKLMPSDRAAFVAQGIAALVDGIWLRGALNPQGIDSLEAVATIEDYLERQLQDFPSISKGNN
ncbi:transcriptional regulator BetI [Enterovibrio norvegicus FF-33]|uniref:HTH-type transcriptional regulator BetI n=1 Tax=Enterovibrio norvegicus FF-454 TaxID=1185651 RepID=A0A1E5CBD9_9GAMM|nr:transcriptional regulator BetI [Enterovibrio norvegicus]OEE62821.1 transcriptional regulator BetI [Enterovibrio norvegicus FF-454]OEE66737.1 transcriptional regulator BetI [Enterovibrio norvegicus FF-33]OEE83125.1 transcriptional regulator BetI [Enterovibrio norvegicus FF-162]